MRRALLTLLVAVLPACEEETPRCVDVWDDATTRAYSYSYVLQSGAFGCPYAFTRTDLDPPEPRVSCDIVDTGRVVETDALCVGTGLIADCFIDGELSSREGLSLSVSRDGDARVVATLRVQILSNKIENLSPGDVCVYRAEGKPLLWLTATRVSQPPSTCPLTTWS